MFESKINRGRANGYAPLDSGSKIPLSHLPPIAPVINTGSLVAQINSLSASISNISFSNTGSFATTGSNTFIGNQTIEGGVTASGFTIVDAGIPELYSSTDLNISANNINVSGTLFVSGNIYANNLTGSIFDTGSFATTGSNIFRGNQNIIGNLNLSGSLNLSSSLTISSTVVNNGTINALNSDLIIDGGDLIVSGASYFSGSLIPNSSGSYDLGSPTNPWRDLYISTSSIKLMNNGEQVNVLTVNDNGRVKVDGFDCSGSMGIAGNIYFQNGIVFGPTQIESPNVPGMAHFNIFGFHFSESFLRIPGYGDTQGDILKYDDSSYLSGFATTGSNLFYGTQTINGNLILSSSNIPTNLTGSLGDINGTIKIDNNSIYYCSGSFVPETYQIIVNQGIPYSTHVFIPKNQPGVSNLYSNGFSITTSGNTTYVLTGVYSDGDNWDCEIDNLNSNYFGGTQTMTLTWLDYEPINIWTKTDFGFERGKFATTGSNIFYGDQTITGSVIANTIIGSLLATNGIISSSNQITALGFGAGAGANLGNFMFSGDTLSNNSSNASTLQVGGNSWIFGSSGQLTFPDSSIQTTAFIPTTYATTGSNVFIGDQIISGSIYFGSGSNITENSSSIIITPAGAAAGQSLVVRQTGIANLYSDHPSGFYLGDTITLTFSPNNNYLVSGSAPYIFTGCTQEQLGTSLSGSLIYNDEYTKTLTWTIPALSDISGFTFEIYNFVFFVSESISLSSSGSSEQSHIHLVSGDPSLVDIYLGDDDQYVKIEKNAGDVVIGTNLDTHHWRFDTSGSLIVPGNIIGAYNLATTGSNTFIGNQIISGSLIQQVNYAPFASSSYSGATTLDITKDIHLLDVTAIETDNHWILPDGLYDGQVVKFALKGDGTANPNGIYIWPNRLRSTLGITRYNYSWSPFWDNSGGSARSLATAVYVDGAWNIDNGFYNLD